MLAIFGDSIANGLGVRTFAYPKLVAQCLHLELADFSGTAQTVSDSLARLNSSTIAPHISIIAHGITEPILRPRQEHLYLLPPRWKRLGWMDPRPYFSSKPWPRYIQKLESGLRWRVKNGLIYRYGAQQLMRLDEYEEVLGKLVGELQRRGSQVILLGAPDIDERFFPGSQGQQIEYAARASEVDVPFIELRGRLHRWNDFLADHFHPNDSGHQRIAEIVLTAIRQEAGLPPHDAP